MQEALRHQDHSGHPGSSRDLLGGTTQSMLETALSAQMKEHKNTDPNCTDSRNGYKPKLLRSSMGEIPISVPQDRDSDSGPQIVPKYKRDISKIEGKVINIYARGMGVWQTVQFAGLCGEGANSPSPSCRRERFTDSSENTFDMTKRQR